VAGSIVTAGTPVTVGDDGGATPVEEIGPRAFDTGVRRRSRHRRRRGRVTIVVLVLILVPLLVLGSGIGWFWYQLGGESSGAEVQVRLQRGWGVSQVAEELADKHVVRSALAFNIYARFNGEKSFQAGTYYLREKLGVRGAVRELKKGPRINYVILKIPPGLWVKQIAARVAALGGGRSAQAFLDGTRNNAVRSIFEPADVSNLEGLLRPDTYKISESQDEIAILQTLVKTFDTRAAALGLTTANVRGYTAYDIIKVASIIEAEAKLDKDRQLIASVIYNRLAAKMPLQIDATVLYARGDPQNRKLSLKDLQIKSPYNTYLPNTGLPPTPIAAVSDKSLLAAMAPADTTYLYYVIAGKDGHHAFSSTAEQWQRDVAAARQQGLL
jgi:UPF0755 protein